MAGRYLIFSLIALVFVVGSAIAVGIATSGSSDAQAGDPLASMDALQDQEVLLLEEHNTYLVYNSGDPLALSDDPQHLEGEHTQWCESSQMFETPSHGEKFDRHGNYYSGPAAKGLDRYAVRVNGDAIYVDFDEVIPGPQRDEAQPLEPEGSFCVPE